MTHAGRIISSSIIFRLICQTNAVGSTWICQNVFAAYRVGLNQLLFGTLKVHFSRSWHTPIFLIYEKHTQISRMRQSFSECLHHASSKFAISRQNTPEQAWQIFADDQGNFWLIFAFCFTICYNSNVLSQFYIWQCNNLNVQSWPKFQSRYRFTRNDSWIVNDLQVWKALTSYPWRYTKFSDGSRNNFIRGTNQLLTAFHPQLTLRIYSMLPGTGRVKGPKRVLFPGAENPRYVTTWEENSIANFTKTIAYSNKSMMPFT